MKFLWLPFFTKKVTQMFIENRINKRNETDSCILRKTCYWDILVKGFSVQKKWEKTISSALSKRLLKADKSVNYKTKKVF